MPGFDEKQVGYFKSMSAKYNRAWRHWIGPLMPILNLCHPETIKVLAKTEEPKFTEAINGHVLAMPWFGNVFTMIIITLFLFYEKDNTVLLCNGWEYYTNMD